MQGIGDIVYRVLKDIKKRKAVTKEEIDSIWKEVVGDEVGAHSCIVSWIRKEIWVNIDSSMWLYQINLEKDIYLREIQYRLGKDKVKDIRLRLGKVG